MADLSAHRGYDFGAILLPDTQYRKQKISSSGKFGSAMRLQGLSRASAAGITV
jgi:hypothetical protein